jgi:hypothetical protein
MTDLHHWNCKGPQSISNAIVDRYENGARSQGYDVHFLGQNWESEQVYRFRLL